MRRILTVMASMLLAGTLGVTAGCGGNGGTASDYGKYESVAGKPAEATFSFETNLKEKSKIYPLSTGGKTYYVAASGNSANDGLTESAPISIDKVGALSLGAGDSVLFKKGDKFTKNLVVNNVSGADDNPVTFASYGAGDKKPVIEFAGDVLSFNKCGNIVVRDLEVSVIGGTYAQGAVNGIIFNYNKVGSAKFRNVYITDNYVHGNGNERNAMGISISSIEDSAKTSPREILQNVYIYGNTVCDLGRSGIHTGGWLSYEKDNQNNTFMDLYRNIFINENDVHNVGNIGIYIVACTNSTINRNLVYKTGMRSASENAEGECGIMALGADTMDIMFNVAYDNRNAGTAYDSMAIDIDWNTTNINVQYNHTYENTGSGIGTMACQNSFIRNNRVENNKCSTNQVAQIQVSDFTSRYACVEDDMHAVKNVKVEENLIIGTPDNRKMFKAQKFNGDSDWEKNSFENNRVVYNGDNVNSVNWIEVDTEVPWYKFANNRYFSSDVTNFKCFDYTGFLDINNEDGATPYEFSKNFSSWQKRDLGATLSELSDNAPSAPTGVTAKFENGELKLGWSASKGDVWHYNVYAVGENEEISYLNMLGWAYENSFSFKPESKDAFYIVVQAESNQGVCGKATKIKVELK